MLYLGADHGGFSLKASLAQHLAACGVAFEDLGAPTEDPADDYPRYAAAVARAVAAGVAGEHRGILACRTGVGMSIAANKVPGVRAALAWAPDIARAARRDENANILALPADHLSPDAAIAIVDAWLAEPFAEVERHARRIRELAELEAGTANP